MKIEEFVEQAKSDKGLLDELLDAGILDEREIGITRRAIRDEALSPKQKTVVEIAAKKAARYQPPRCSRDDVVIEREVRHFSNGLCSYCYHQFGKLEKE